MGSKGFTRVEALVVAVTLAVVAGVLASALHAMEEERQQSQSLQRAHNWPLVWQMYSVDNRGRMAMPKRALEEWGDAWSHSWRDSPKGGELGGDARASVHKPADDPSRDCRETVFASVSPYVGNPKLFLVAPESNDPLNSTWGKAPYQQLIGQQGGACSELLGSHPCYWGGDGTAHLHCEGWNIGYAPGSKWWYPGPGKTEYTLDQWITNTVPNTGANALEKGWSFTGPARHWTAAAEAGKTLDLDFYARGTAGPDGLLMASVCEEVENGTDAALVAKTGVLRCTAASVAGAARTFEFKDLDQSREEGVSLFFAFTRYWGWLEMVQWANGQFPAAK